MIEKMVQETWQKKYFIFQFLFLCIFQILFSQENENEKQVKSITLDSQTATLLHQITNATKEKERIKLYIQLCEILNNSEPIKARKYAQIALELSEKNNYKKEEAESLKNIGVVYQLQGNASQALEYFFNALKIYENIKDEKGIAQTMNNVGVVYQGQEKYEEAQKYYQNVLKIDEKVKDEEGQASTLNNLGDIFYQQDKLDLAFDYYEKSLQLRKKLAHQQDIAVSFNNMGLVYYAKNNYKKALYYYYQAMKIDILGKSEINLSSTYNNIANTYLKSEKIDSSYIFALKSLSLAEKHNLSQELQESSQTLSEIYTIKKNYEKAFEYQSLYLMSKEAQFNEKNKKKIENLQTSYEVEKAHNQLALQNKKRQLQDLIIGAVSIGLGLVVLLALVLLRSYQLKKRDNNLLSNQNTEIIRQKEAIEVKNQAITLKNDEIEKRNKEIALKNHNIESSIRYAQRIQAAMLPSKKQIDVVLPNFVYFLPRDVVSGDFYWFYQTEKRPIYEQVQVGEEVIQKLIRYENEKIIFSANDCTGHGVPGAFMSMIGDSLLNQIVGDKGICSPELIIKEMNNGIIEALQQQETHNRDGMDMMVCVIDMVNKTVEYSGAKNTLLYVQNGEIMECKADNLSVGGWQGKEFKDRNYTKYTLSFAESPLNVFMYSDGYQDQFGGENNRKFSKKQLRELLLKIANEPMTYQRSILEDTFLSWKGSQMQMDDVLVAGFRVS